MNNVVREAMISILERLVERSDRVWNIRWNEAPVETHAGLALVRAGHLAKFDSPTHYGYQITLSGFAYLEELNHPAGAWLRRNWFPAAVAGATLLVATVSSFAQVWVALRV